ncbi:putative Adhesin [Burkholderia cenocepacia]|uniref:YadA-like family protein n=1 Tax=Burkholderia cenocepacia TaxID=95486 RepID=UPI00192C7019|nr:YadA-like family protein [Burkholderia cenocepacia]CAD9228068.1 putative Adhesin [Burkholderia cenocepacia]
MNIKKTIMALSIATLTSNVFAVSFALAAGPGSTEYGSGAGASGTNGTAIGSNAAAGGPTSTGATAIGASSGSSSNGTAVGASTTAGVGGTAVGANTTADNGATAVGSNTMATGQSVVVGNNSGGDMFGGVIGNNSTTGTAQNAWVIGNGITATRNNEVAIGGKTIGGVGTATANDQAVNLGQMNSAISTAISSIPTSSTDTNAIHYDSTTATATLAGPNGTELKNVAAGTTGTSAANVNQVNQAQAAAVSQSKTYTDTKAVETLQSANQYTDQSSANDRAYTDSQQAQTLQKANQYTDSQVAPLRNDINELRGQINGLSKRIDSVAAMAAAQSSIVYNNGGSHVQMGVGAGFSRSSSAIAVRAMIASPSKRFIYSLGVSASTGGQTSVGAGMSFSF